MRRTVFVPTVAEGRIDLDRDESHYLRHVLRLGVGESFPVTDGRGGTATARLITAGRERATVELSEIRTAALDPRRVVFLGRPKPALVEEALTLGTEAGATAFWLVPVRYSPPGSLREERIARILEAAVRQSRRTWTPEVRSFGGLPEALSALGATSPDERGALWLAAPGAPPLRPSVPYQAAVVAIGPEAGFAPEEAQALQGSGFVPASIGPHILRAPTAVAIALALASHGADGSP